MTAVDKIALDELLRQRAAALFDPTRAQVHPHRARDRLQIDTVVGGELVVLDRLDRGGQERRHLVGRQHDPVLAMDREDAADQQRIEPEDRDRGTVRGAQARDGAAFDRHGDDLRRALLVREARGTHRDLEAPAAAPVAARARKFRRFRYRNRSARRAGPAERSRQSSRGAA